MDGTQNMGQDLYRNFRGAVDSAMALVGRRHFIRIGGRPVDTGQVYKNFSPVDRGICLGSFTLAGPQELKAALEAAYEAFEGWEGLPAHSRLTFLRRAADRLMDRWAEIAALLTLELGMTWPESYLHIQEAHARVLEACGRWEAWLNGPDGQPPERGKEPHLYTYHRPYGPWLIFTAFTSPIATPAGLIAEALLAGNTIVLKPSSLAPLAALELVRIFTDAGIPPGVINVLLGSGRGLLQGLQGNRGPAGIAYAGSLQGLKGITGWTLSRELYIPFLWNVKGNNVILITENAHLQRTLREIVRAAFGFAGQGEWSSSWMVVIKKGPKGFLDGLVEQIVSLKVGDPREMDSQLGPLIGPSARDRFISYLDSVRREGKLLAGGEVIQDPPLDKGAYVRPVIVREIGYNDPLIQKSIRLPVVRLVEFKGLEDAICFINALPFAYYTALFAEEGDGIRYLLDSLRTPIVAINRIPAPHESARDMGAIYGMKGPLWEPITPSRFAWRQLHLLFPEK